MRRVITVDSPVIAQRSLYNCCDWDSNLWVTSPVTHFALLPFFLTPNCLILFSIDRKSACWMLTKTSSTDSLQVSTVLSPVPCRWMTQQRHPQTTLTQPPNWRSRQRTCHRTCKRYPVFLIDLNGLPFHCSSPSTDLFLFSRRCNLRCMLCAPTLPRSTSPKV